MRLPACIHAICFLLLTSYRSEAQHKPFAPGFYITKNGDTLSGHLSFDKKPSPAFRFKKELHDSSTSVVPFHSCRFIASANASFTNVLVSRDMTHIDKTDFTIRSADSSITAEIPVRLLYKGVRFSLYHYQDVKDHFFIHDGTSMQELLLKYRYLTEWEKQSYIRRDYPAYYIFPVFRQQLIALMNNQMTKAQLNLIEQTTYDERSLTKLFKTLDRSHAPD